MLQACLTYSLICMSACTPLGLPWRTKAMHTQVLTALELPAQPVLNSEGHLSFNRMLYLYIRAIDSDLVRESFKVSNRTCIEWLSNCVWRGFFFSFCVNHIFLFVWFRHLRDGTLREHGVCDGSRLTLLPSVETGLLVSLFYINSSWLPIESMCVCVR